MHMQLHGDEEAFSCLACGKVVVMFRAASGECIVCNGDGSSHLSTCDRLGVILGREGLRLRALALQQGQGALDLFEDCWEAPDNVGVDYL